MGLTSWPESEWTTRRALIEDLYSVKGYTMDEVRQHLCQTGFEVSTRMVKTRLLRWNLHKKLSLVEAHTALDLIGPDRESWPCKHPTFRIRRRTVSLDQILRFCHRRSIRDPFDWIQKNPIGELRSPNVELQKTELIAAESLDDGIVEPASVPSAEATERQPLQAPDGLDESGSEHIGAIRTPNCDAPVGPTVIDLPINRMRSPDVYILAAQAIQEFQSYCLNYITSGHAAIGHCEPPVHQFTYQGRLQNHVDEGAFHFARNNMNSAFSNFELAFLVIEEMLEDVHPMAIAQYFMLLCRLTATKANVVARKMLEHTLHLCHIRKTVSSRLIQALQAICGSGEFMEISLLCLRAAVDCMGNSHPWEWKGLYIKERYCHSLVLSAFTGEGFQRRLELLDEQQNYYGISARNVLWTALCVAEDCILQGRLQEAKFRYDFVLQQSNNLSGFHRAKVRAGALSGLAEVAIARARLSCDLRYSSSASTGDVEVALQQLVSAEHFAKEALGLAEVWFDGTATRRVALLRERHAEILAQSLQVECVFSTV